MDSAKLNWSGAKVEDAKLAVELAGELPAGWKKSFEATVRLLGGGDWGKVKLKKHSIQVAHVTPGSEEKVRFFLESVVEQANAARAPESPAGAEGEERAEAEDGTPDAAMTRAFRAFAQPEAEDAEAPGGRG